MLDADNCDVHFIEREAKLNIVQKINTIIEQRKLTQIQAADLIKATQPDVSKIKNMQLEGFTLDRLLCLLYRLDNTIQMKIVTRSGDTNTQPADHVN